MSNNKKLNVILDLDSTLINAVENRDKIKVPSDSGLLYKDWIPFFRIYERPYLQEFLDYLFDNFNVSVFTAADKDYALFIVDKFVLNKNPKRKLDFFFFRYHVELSNKHYSGVKDLRLIWDLFKIYGFYPCNTLIIDDLNLVEKTNPYNTIPIKAFDVLDKNGNYNTTMVNDDSLLSTIEKLKYIKQRFDSVQGSLNGSFSGCKDNNIPLLKRHDII